MLLCECIIVDAVGGTVAPNFDPRIRISRIQISADAHFTGAISVSWVCADCFPLCKQKTRFPPF